MIVEDRDAFIRNAKLDHIIVRYVFAKTLYAVVEDLPYAKKMDVEDVWLEAVASVVMNRFVFESEIMDSYPDMVQILTDTTIFRCWENLRRMDAIDSKDTKFRKCLKIASNALSGKLPDTVNGAKSLKEICLN